MSEEPRPDGAKFWLAADVVKWIDDNCEPIKGDTSEGRAIWWSAYRNAEAMFDSFTTKDLARTLLDGITPHSLADVATDVQVRYEDVPVEDANTAIEADLTRFFKGDR